MATALKTREPAVEYGTPPRANLLPPAEKERRALRRLQRRWIVGVLAVLGVALLGFLVALGIRVEADLSVAKAEDRRSELQTDLAEYSDISSRVADRDNLEAKRDEVMAADMAWTRPFNLLSPALPNGAKITGMSAAAGGAPTGVEDEIGLKGVVTVVSGRPIDQAIVLEAFADVDHVVDVDLLGLEQAEGVYTYNIFVTFDQGIYNFRFSADPTQEEGQ